MSVAFYPFLYSFFEQQYFRKRILIFTSEKGLDRCSDNQQKVNLPNDDQSSRSRFSAGACLTLKSDLDFKLEILISAAIQISYLIVFVKKYQPENTNVI